MHGVHHELGKREQTDSVRWTLAGRVRRRAERPASLDDGRHLSRERVDALDAELAGHAHSCGRLRFEIALGLEALAQRGGHHELGFPSLEAYALERLERSGSWVQKSRTLVRRLESLPRLRTAHIQGRVTGSMTTLLATIATPEDEASWLAEAERLTVREMTARIAAASAQPQSDPRVSALDAPDDDELRCHLTVTVPREDAWLFEAARLVAKHLGERTVADACEAIVSEGMTSMHGHLAPLLDVDPNDERRHAQRAWETELRRMRIASEELCESRMKAQRSGLWSTSRGVTTSENAPPRDWSSAHESVRSPCDTAASENAPPLDWSSAHQSVRSPCDTAASENAPPRDWSSAHESVLDIDAELRGVAAELASRDLAFGSALEAFFAADGWRRLGYSTAAHYARERLGLSLSSIKDRRQLARRIRKLPALGRAIQERVIGYEAARLVASVATPVTINEWLTRARERTVRHLREEIDAAELAARHTDKSVVLPPGDDLLRQVRDFERGVMTGHIFPGDGSPLAAGSDAPIPLARNDRRARVTLRLRVRRSTARTYRQLEAIFLRNRLPSYRATFLHFLCADFIETWRPKPNDVAYRHIYDRDLFECQNPVCGRRDLTPHHLRFRSAGGDDSDDNVTSLCTWCHLEGIHGGRISAEPPADAIRWSLGRTRHTVIEGRRRCTEVYTP